MAIENMENESVISNEAEKGETYENETPTSVEEVEKRFADPTEIMNTAEIVPFFENNFDKKRLCIAIPITIEDEETRKRELLQIGTNLRRAVFGYIGLGRDSAIGASLKNLIGEATSDVAKHTVLRDRFAKILVLVTKDDLDISFHLVNPARSDVNLHEINQEDSNDEYGLSTHGRSFAKGLGTDLLKSGCQSVTDESHLVQDASSEVVAVERDIFVELPHKTVKTSETSGTLPN